jgi:hypothetical protein
LPTFNSFDELRKYYFPKQYIKEHILEIIDELFYKEISKEDFLKLMDEVKEEDKNLRT